MSTENTQYSLEAAIETLQRIKEHSCGRPWQIVVRTHNPGALSGGQTSDVQGIYAGFDWEAGQVIVTPVKPLTELTPEQVQAITKSVREGQSWHAYQAQKKLRERIDELQDRIKELAAAPAVQPEPQAQWDDPRVQRVYEVLCSNEAPPPEQHWEGWVARRIVDALAAVSAAQAEPIAIVKRGTDGKSGPLLWLGTVPDDNTPLYVAAATGAQAEPLSLDRLKELALQEQLLLLCDDMEALETITRAVEQAHGIT